MWLRNAVVLLVAAVAGWAGDLPVTAPEGWQVTETRTYTAANLYGYIDGGAELFLEFGFQRCVAMRLVRGHTELTADLYEMTEPLAALGVYLAKCSPEQPMEGVPCRNSGDTYQLALVRGNWFVFINNFDGDAALVPVMKGLARRFAAAVPDTPTPLPSPMPETGVVSGSLRLARGPVALQPVVTLGPDDILRQHRTHWAVIADVKRGDWTETRIAVRYPDADTARAAFSWLTGHLDPTLIPVATEADRLVFQDYRNQFGTAERTGRDVVIGIGLATAPAASNPTPTTDSQSGGIHP